MNIFENVCMLHAKKHWWWSWFETHSQRLNDTTDQIVPTHSLQVGGIYFSGNFVTNFGKRNFRVFKKILAIYSPLQSISGNEWLKSCVEYTNPVISWLDFSLNIRWSLVIRFCFHLHNCFWVSRIIFVHWKERQIKSSLFCRSLRD